MQFVRNLKHIFAIWCITLVALFGVVRLFGADFLIDITHRLIYRETGIASKLYQYHFVPSKDIVIIKIGEESLNYFTAIQNGSNLSLGKNVYNDLVINLQSVGVKSIGFDILFQNRDPDYERTFAETLEKNQNVVIATTESFNECQPDAGGTEKTCIGIPRSVYGKAKWGIVTLENTGDRRVISTKFSGLPYSINGDMKEADTLALSMIKSASTLDSNKLSSFISRNNVILNPFFGVGDIYKSFELSRVSKMTKLELVEYFSGKYVLVGTRGALLQDQHESPVTGESIDGVEFHAHMLDGFLQNRFLREISMNEGMLYIISLLLLSLISIIAYLFLPKFISPIVALVTLVFLVFLSRYLYFNSGIVIEIFPVLLAGGIFSFPATFIYRFFIIDREKRALTSAFSHYVDPTLVREIADKSAEINLGGESRELTILFSDIAGFTTLSEKLSPSDLFYLMSSYLSQMTDILIAQGGTLDKYIGDAVMGFFGAPLPEVDHARRACDTALLMRQALPAFNTELVSRGLDPIDFRIGIASGEVLVGNIGSHDRFNYTVLGDTVNLASRLEATSKEYGTHTIIAEPTYLLLEGAYFCRALDRVAVKGKQEGVLIYELIAKNDDIKISREKYIRYEEALKLYFEGKYLEAGQIFEANMTDDVPSKIMALRCVEILRGTITVEGGVYRMTHK